MSIWIRIGSVVCVLALHLSFISLVPLGIIVPVVPIAATVIWTFLFGFPRVLWPVCFMIVVSDSVLFGAVRFISVYFVLVAYVVSFFMKRTLVGDRDRMSSFLLSLFAGAAGGGYVFFIWLLGYSMSNLSDWSRVSFWSMFVGTIGLNACLTMLSYILLFPVLQWFENTIRAFRWDGSFVVK